MQALSSDQSHFLIGQDIFLSFTPHNPLTPFSGEWHIWNEIDRGALPESMDDPEWHRTQRVLHEFFAHAIEQARTDWVEIELDRTSLCFMEAHFLDEGWLNCQCKRHTQKRHQRLAAHRRQRHSSQNAEAPVGTLYEMVNVPRQRAEEVLLHTSASISTSREHVQLTLFP
jgi:hypothetical protein